MVVERYRQIAMSEGPRSKAGGARAQAAQSMGTLRALLSFGAIEYESDDGTSAFPPNPVLHLSRLHRGWGKIAPRRDVIAPDDLKAWSDALMDVPNDTTRDYILFCLFMGLRRSAAAAVKWDNVNMKSKTVSIPIADDKTKKAFVLPLPVFIHDMLKRRSKIRRLENPYVFPALTGTDHIKEPKRAVEKVIAKSGVHWSMHALRRTFATTAERLEISVYKTKALMNHSISRDVTGNYIQIQTDQLREPIQKIADFLLSKMKPETDQVVTSELLAVSQ
jgi:integrase